MTKRPCGLCYMVTQTTTSEYLKAISNLMVQQQGVIHGSQVIRQYASTAQVIECHRYERKIELCELEQLKGNVCSQINGIIPAFA